MAENDGGPAFPVLELDQRSGNVFAQHMGMSLRDYFAGQALTGIHASREQFLAVLADRGPGGRQDPLSAVAAAAYSMADAMLAGREKGGA